MTRQSTIRFAALAAVVLCGTATLPAQTAVRWGDLGPGGTLPPTTLPIPRAVSIGYNGAMVVNTDGSITGWGSCDSAQVPAPTAAQSGIVAVAVGDTHCVVLKNDGSVIGWGSGNPVSMSGMIAIAAGSNNTVGLKSDGTITVLGGPQPPPGLTGVIAIACAQSEILVLKSDGTVVAWGSPASPGPPVPAGLSNVVAIAASAQHYMALKSDGTVTAWGSNIYGESDVPSGLAGVIAISASVGAGLALRSDGTIVSWGAVHGPVGAIPAGLSGVVSIAAGGSMAIAVKGQGFSGWGDNSDGQVVMTANPYSAIAAGGNFSLGLKTNGTVDAWGRNAEGETAVPEGDTSLGGGWGTANDVKAISAGTRHGVALTFAGTVRAWGSDNSGQTDVPSGLTGIKATSAGTDFTLALRSNGTVAAWGFNSQGQATVPAGLNGVIAIAAGGAHALALKSNHTVAAWGSNTQGQATVPAGLSGVIAIAAGGAHALALKSDGTVVAWGDNSSGQTTIPAGLAGVIAIAAGNSQSVALKSDGTVVVWGSAPAPPVGLTGVTSISAGSTHLLALTASPAAAVTIATTPAGIGFTVAGSGCLAGNYSGPKTFNWVAGLQCSLTINSPQLGAPGTQYVFTGWSDGTTTLTDAITATAGATTYTAATKTQYLLTTLLSPAGTGTVSGGGFYDAGSAVPVVATPNAGNLFLNWTGPVTPPNAASGQVTVNAATTVTANFQIGTTTAVANVSGQYSDPVTLSATVAPASAVFAATLQFQVDGANVGSPIPIPGGGSYTLPYVVNLPAGSHTVTASVSPGDSVSVGSAGTGTLTVTPENATFTLSGGNPQTLTVGSLSGITVMLTGMLQEQADGSAGNLGLATVTASLAPVNGGANINCTVTNSNGLIMAMCPGVTANTYKEQWQIQGNYYTGPAVNGSLVVNEPAAFDITAALTVAETASTFDSSGQTGTETYTLTNASSQTISGPLYLALSLPSGVTPSGNAGTLGSTPYWSIQGVTTLAPGASATVTVSLSYSSGIGWPTAIMVFAGIPHTGQ